MIKKFGIITDSGADFSLDYMKKHDLILIPTRIMVGETEYIDRETITREEIIDKMINEKAKTSTSVAPPVEFHRIINDALQKYEKVLFIAISSKMSATLQQGILTAKRIDPERFVGIDTNSVSWGMTLLIDHAIRRRNQGIDIDTVLKEIKQMMESLKLYFMVDTLEYLRRGGRIGAAKSMLGKLIGAKPILTLDDGELKPDNTVKSFEECLSYFTEKIKENTKDQKNYVLAFIYGLEDPEFKKYANEIKQELKPLHFFYEPIGANIISHAGPKLYGFGFVKIPDEAVDSYK
jgi:DegV family protein with EDD domain